jgi:UrcA family protein
MPRTPRALIAAMAIAITAIPAMATAAPYATVRYSDLDLTTDEGRDILDARIERAVRAVCPGSTEAVRILRERADAECQAAARSQIETKLADRVPANRLGG